jgi:hypothetical protein
VCSCYLTIFLFCLERVCIYYHMCLTLFLFLYNFYFKKKKKCYLTVNFNGRKKKTKEGFCSITYFFEPFCKKKTNVLKLLRKIAFLWNSSLPETSFTEKSCKILELVFSTDEFQLLKKRVPRKSYLLI